MSFFTTVEFYRPRTPPIITTSTWASFLESLADIALTDGVPFYGTEIKVKFGKRVDQDDNEICRTEPNGDMREIEWDFKCKAKSFAAVTRALRQEPNRPIYRSFATLGFLEKPVCKTINREPSEKNKHGLYLDSLGAGIVPVILSDLGDDEDYQVGWVSVYLCGQGYLYPWTRSELISRIRGLPKLLAVEELCRRTWPVSSERPGPEIIEIRKKVPHIWGDGDFDAPWDWRWGISET
jgi:hypothetical protein